MMRIFCRMARSGWTLVIVMLSIKFLSTSEGNSTVTELNPALQATALVPVIVRPGNVRTGMSIASASRAVVVRRNGVRFISFLKMKETFQRLLNKNSNELPYTHICQVGDPVLRGHAMKVEPEVVRMADFQKVITRLMNVMRTYNAFGLSGPQIGLPWQIFAIECTEVNMKGIEESVRKAREMSIVPMTIFINPKLKIIDYTSVTYYERCESIRGYTAAVPRAYEVEITALNASAEQFTWKARGWPARIAQHEYDHLQGRLYIEKMDIKTFHCMAWEQINKYKGKVRLSYWPKK